MELTLILLAKAWTAVALGVVVLCQSLVIISLVRSNNGYKKYTRVLEDMYAEQACKEQNS